MKLTKKAIKAVTSIASTDRARPALQNVKVERHNGTVDLMATDGRALIRLTAESGLEGGESWSANIPAHALNDAAKVMQQTARHADALTLENELGAVKGKINGADYFAALPTSSLDYPEYQKVLPADEPVFEIALAPDLTLQVLEALSAVAECVNAKNKPSIRFAFYGPDRVVKMTVFGPGRDSAPVAVALQMPVRTS